MAAKVVVLGSAAVALAACGLAGTASQDTLPTTPSASSSPTKDFPGLADFTDVSVTGPIAVQLRAAETATVQVRTSGLDPSSLFVSSVGGVLQLGLMPGVDWADIGEVEAVVSAPSLRALELSGGARARTGMTLDMEGLILDLADASTFNAVVNVSGGVLAELDGGSRLDLDGTAGSLEVVLANGSAADTEGLRAGDVRVTASAASTASVTVAGALGVRATGGSVVRYSGQPTLIVHDIDSTSELVPVQ